MRTRALALELTHEPLPADEVLAGEPATGHAELGSIGDCRVGVWEMTPGTARDVEADEVFVVLTGAASVLFVDEGESLDLAPGDVVTLSAGQRTEWTVTETLRKVYVTA